MRYETYPTANAESDNWRADALCAQTNSELFFPEKGGGTRSAKKVCQECEVRPQCLEFAFQNNERFGVWGGLSERERRKLDKMGQAAIAVAITNVAA